MFLVPRGKRCEVVLGDRFDPRVLRSAAKRRALAIELTREHYDALASSPAPREILATNDAAGPGTRARTYEKAREAWLAAGAVALPDVFDQVRASRAALPPLRPEDVRIPFPPGTRRARLRRLDPAFALHQVEGKPAAPARVAGARAGLVLVDVAHADLRALGRQYRAALRALGLRVHEERPSKWIDEDFVQLRGRAPGIVVSVTARPARDGAEIGVTWIEGPRVSLRRRA